MSLETFSLADLNALVGGLKSSSSFCIRKRGVLLSSPRFLVGGIPGICFAVPLSFVERFVPCPSRRSSVLFHVLSSKVHRVLVLVKNDDENALDLDQNLPLVLLDGTTDDETLKALFLVLSNAFKTYNRFIFTEAKCNENLHFNEQQTNALIEQTHS